jgi:hypothetical protein
MEVCYNNKHNSGVFFFTQNNVMVVTVCVLRFNVSGLIFNIVSFGTRRGCDGCVVIPIKEGRHDDDNTHDFSV